MIYWRYLTIFRLPFTETQIQTLAHNLPAFKAGKRLSNLHLWLAYGRSDRVVWGQIKGSGPKSYFTQIDIQDLAFKCSCPSHQFPCKHSLGLMLVFTQINEQNISTEPEWVQGWINKRRSKTEKPKVNKIQTAQDKERLKKAKEKRQANRMILVNSGVQELSLWLEDIVRVGLLELPKQTPAFYNKMIARMIDAQASGLARWVRILSQTNYSDTEHWHEEVIDKLGKINLLLKSWKNYKNHSPLQQLSLRNMIGWSQSTKDLRSDATVTGVSDHWIVLGQETEENDDIITQRNWLWSCESNKCCLILNFGSRFAPLESTIISGSILDAEVVYFPATLPQRGIIKQQHNLLDKLETIPRFLSNFEQLQNEMIRLEEIDPWLDNEAFLLADLNLIFINKSWLLIDKDGLKMKVHNDFEDEKGMKCMLISGNASVHLSVVLRDNMLIPLGIFSSDQYLLL